MAGSQLIYARQKFKKLFSTEKLDGLMEFLNPLQTLQIFERIQDRDIILFNMNKQFSHPKNLILTHIIVPPPCIRPTVKEEDFSNRHDDLTVKMKDFLEINERLMQKIDEGEEFTKISADWYLLQCHHCLYLNAETPNMPILDLKKQENKDIRAFAQRLKGKKGRFRQNLSGKRSNFTGRTVISPDPNLLIDNIIVPE